MKEIQLTQGKVALVDDEDFEGLNQHKWWAVKIRTIYYAVRRIRKSTNIHMHQDILGKKPSMVTDHIDGDGLNNCRQNLRHVTPRQNLQNRHIKQSSRYPGVSWHKGRWRARLWLGGKSYNLGRYSHEQEAFEAYKKAVKEHAGEDVLTDAVMRQEGTSG